MNVRLVFVRMMLFLSVAAVAGLVHLSSRRMYFVCRPNCLLSPLTLFPVSSYQSLHLLRHGPLSFSLEVSEDGWWMDVRDNNWTIPSVIIISIRQRSKEEEEEEVLRRLLMLWMMSGAALVWLRASEFPLIRDNRETFVSAVIVRCYTALGHLPRTPSYHSSMRYISYRHA